jgi:hypothetical protein
MPDNSFGMELLNNRARKNVDLEKKFPELNKVPPASSPHTDVAKLLFIFLMNVYIYFFFQ